MFRRTWRLDGLVWVAIGLFICAGSIRLNLGTLHKPGSGLTPFVTGILLTALGVILNLWRSLARGEGQARGGENPLRNFGKKGLLSLLSLVLYALLLEPLGFLIATFFCLLSLFKIMRPRGWGVPVLISLASVIVSYFVFSVWLRIDFPRGWLNIG